MMRECRDAICIINICGDIPFIKYSIILILPFGRVVIHLSRENSRTQSSSLIFLFMVNPCLAVYMPLMAMRYACRHTRCGPQVVSGILKRMPL